MDMLEILVREDRVKLLVEKKRPLWLKEEKDKEAGIGQPITFSEDDQSWLDDMLESDSEEEDEEEEEEGEKKEEEKLPGFPDDWVWKKPTPEELAEQRISDYINMLRRMNTYEFTRLCVREGVVNGNEVFHTICVAHD
tara:strand:+ start:2158 stop:2571 length:414 start_codon:yes stop_codon:yes gene_type:complete